MPSEPEVMPSFTMKVETPDGNMFISVCEDGAGSPIRIEITIGKAGTALMAWANAVSRLSTLALNRGVSLTEILCEVSGISSERQATRLLGRTSVKSGPDGLAKALMMYLMR